jgi:hypothetical protein
LDCIIIQNFDFSLVSLSVDLYLQLQVFGSFPSASDRSSDRLIASAACCARLEWMRAPGASNGSTIRATNVAAQVNEFGDVSPGLRRQRQ